MSPSNHSEIMQRKFPPRTGAKVTPGQPLLEKGSDEASLSAGVRPSVHSSVRLSTESLSRAVLDSGAAAADAAYEPVKRHSHRT